MGGGCQEEEEKKRGDDVGFKTGVIVVLGWAWYFKRWMKQRNGTGKRVVKVKREEGSRCYARPSGGAFSRDTCL